MSSLNLGGGYIPPLGGCENIFDVDWLSLQNAMDKTNKTFFFVFLS